MTEDFQLNDRAHAWTNGILAQYKSRTVTPAESHVAVEIAEVGNFKML
jgi:hypothetical protein